MEVTYSLYVENINHLFRNNHKRTYSRPQKLPIFLNIQKCACGHDFIVILTQENKLYCQYQSALYKMQLTQLIPGDKIVDVYASDNTVLFVLEKQ